MDTTPHVLADGQLANSKATIYTVPTGSRAVITFFSIFNTGGATETVAIYLKPSGTSRRIGGYSLTTITGARVISVGETICLEAGDVIEGSSTNATVTDYVISGFLIP